MVESPTTRRRATRGACFLCQGEFGKRAMVTHLEKHFAEQAAHPGPRAKRFHLIVQGAYGSEYWLNLDVRADATLADLDHFLRGIWLECCGHLSAFTIGERRYEDTRLEPEDEEDMEEDAAFFALLPAFRRRAPKRMTTPLAEILMPGLTFTHEYDFGSATELKLRVQSEHEGPGKKDAVLLLARNIAPEMLCEECGQPAAWLGVDEDGEYRELCKECAKRAKLDEWLLPVVNSPRAGVCGYEG